MQSLLNWDLALTNYNQHTGRYNLPLNAAGNDVVFDNTAAYQIQTAAGCLKGQWWADASLGSDLATLKHLTSRTPQQAAAMLEEAFAPLVTLNFVAALPTVLPPKQIISFVNTLSLDVNWTNPGGAQQSGSIQL